ncbi:MAG: cyclic pyranopterin monophosphate synthase MoaC, partial [Desulfobulbaceae bacterium]
MENKKKSFSHFDDAGNAVMVDVGAKRETERIAYAAGSIKMSSQAFELVKSGSMEKGDVLGVARIAGIMAAKKVDELIPLT